MRVVDSQQMKQIEQKALDQYHIPHLILMENAAYSLYDFLNKKFKLHEYNIIILSGPGNNGGDGLALARLLVNKDYRPLVFSYGEKSELKKQQKEMLKFYHHVYDFESDFESFLSFLDQGGKPNLVIDGLLGSGVKRDVSGVLADIIDATNQKANLVVSIDLPSGIDSDTGEIHGSAIKAHHTVSLGFTKIGLLLPASWTHVGQLHHADISLPKPFFNEGDHLLLDEQSLPKLGKRSLYGHKNSFGHVLVIGGFEGKTGAPVLAANAALRMGSGLLTIATFQNSFPELMSRCPTEVMGLPLKFDEHYGQYRDQLKTFNTILIGPGLGTDPNAYKLVCDVALEYQGPIVIDADGINCLNDKIQTILSQRKFPTILTPHFGEMARLTKIPKDKLLKNPIEACRETAERLNACIVLKGAATFICESGKPIVIHYDPNDALAKAGSGDILAGMIASFVAGGMSVYDSAKLSVYFQAKAGRAIAEKIGSRSAHSRNIIDELGKVMKDFDLK